MTQPTFDKEEFIFKYTMLSATTSVVLALAIAAVLPFFTDASNPGTLYDFVRAFTNILMNSLNLALSVIISIVAIDAVGESRLINGVPKRTLAKMYQSVDYNFVACVDIVMGAVCLYTILCIGNVDAWAANAFGASIKTEILLITWINWICGIALALKVALMGLRSFYYKNKL